MTLKHNALSRNSTPEPEIECRCCGLGGCSSGDNTSRVAVSLKVFAVMFSVQKMFVVGVVCIMDVAAISVVILILIMIVMMHKKTFVVIAVAHCHCCCRQGVDDELFSCEYVLLVDKGGDKSVNNDDHDYV